MASDVEICNLGLANTGHTKFLESLTEDSTEANVCKAFFDQKRDEVLRDYRWPFAKRVTYPAALVASTLKTTVVPDEWGYAFAYPADCVFFRGVFPGVRNPLESQKIEHELHNDGNKGLVILTDQGPPLAFVYTARVTDTTQFAADFVDALSWKIAMLVALSVRKDAKVAQLAAGGYQAALAKAAANAAAEIQLRRPEAPHIAARR